MRPAAPKFEGTDLMLKTESSSWLRRISRNQPKQARYRTARRQAALFDGPAEILEGRELLTASPYLVFSTQPTNIIAGHDLKFRVTAMINVQTNFGTVPEVDTAFTGTCSIVAIGPGTFDTPIDTSSPQGPNVPFPAVMQPFVNGVASNHAKLTSIDVAGNYQLHAVAIVTPPNVTAAAVMSNTFMVSPFSATDRLVFLHAPTTATVDRPFSVTVAAEDEFGNVDTGVTSVPVELIALPGNAAQAQMTNGEATFNDAFFVAAGPDTLLAISSHLVGTDLVETFGANGG
jgi:hypothetical protein